MDLIERDQVLYTNKISYLYPDFKSNNKSYITVQNILEHNSGKTLTN